MCQNYKPDPGFCGSTVNLIQTVLSDGHGGFSTTTPLPVAGPVGYTVRVLPHHPLLASDTELGLVTLA